MMTAAEFMMKYPQYTTKVAGIKAVDYSKVSTAINESGQGTQLARDFEALQQSQPV